MVRPPKHRKIDYYLAEGWSRDLAWIVGVVYGDGYTKYQPEFSRYHVNLHGGDDKVAGRDSDGYQLLARWRDLVDPGVEVAASTDTGKSWIVEVSSLNFAKFFDDLGINGRKSGLLPWPETLPVEFLPDFVRGLWDTDGSVLLKSRRAAQGSVELRASISLKADPFIHRLATILPIPGKVKQTTITKGPYAGNVYDGIGFSSTAALVLCDWMYGCSTNRVRHEGKYNAYIKYKKYIENGCVVCKQPITMLGRCKDHYSSYKYPNQNKDRTCSRCGSLGVTAKLLCRRCYQADWQKKALTLGHTCPCGKPVACSSELCPKCASAKRRKQEDAGAFGVCACGSPAFSKGLCRSCYDKQRYALKTSGATPMITAVRSRVIELQTTEFPFLTEFLVNTPAELNNLSSAVPTFAGDVIIGWSRAGNKVCLLETGRLLLETKNSTSDVSLLEAFKSSTWLRKAVEFQIKSGDPTDVAGVVRALRFMIKAPGNFPPSIAKWVVDTYCPKNGVVFDPCAGFGGRLLGASISSSRPTYIACDVSAPLIEALHLLVDRLDKPLGGIKGRVQLTASSAEDMIWPESDLIFTSPPYFSAEIYSSDPDQSAHRYPTYEAWKTNFFAPLFTKAAGSLRPGGKLGLVVRDVRRKNKLMYPLEAETRDQASAAGLVSFREIEIKLPAPSKRPERLLMFQKS